MSDYDKNGLNRCVRSRGGCFGAGYRLYLGVRCFMLKKFVLGGMVVVAALLGNACGGDDSSDSSPVLAAEESSSSVDETLSSSTTETPSSSAKDKESSSSVKSKASSSFEKSAKSSSSKDTEPGDKSSSSMKNGGSSSSAKTKESSSSEMKEVSSSSEKPVESSSSEKVEESSSSEKSSSSSAKSSSSEESSSSETKPSSSEKSSSGEEQNSSSSLESTGICKTKTEDNCVYGTLYDDRDGKTYKTIKIGEQEWMAQSLNFEITDIANSSIRSYCPMDSDSCSKYGRYYTWSAVIDSVYLYEKKSIKCGYKIKCELANRTVKGVCPNGWHVPNQREWNSLITFVGIENAGNLLKGFDGWAVWPGDDAYGFSALAAGYVVDRKHYYKDNKLSFWIALDNDQYSAKAAVFNYSQTRKDEVLIQSVTKDSGSALTVRCIKD